MKWAVTLYGGRSHRERITFEAENADLARRIAVKELKAKNARVFELERLD
ncbi:hypothetical protein [Thermococcus gammatolerans]|uniref:Uncharacterized protein n=1 Tax=Thermococcus gammatolerans (strain DSM 15229 / JCM 11827 / EJ3) TaxID=593117 RepID=C5A7I2_THEGJ|nr:hypothetical protein [Thermococcus gammatolerans]ACS34194.1 Conserved hypothetical protein [Thermococcus gammatolerans EJ3]